MRKMTLRFTTLALIVTGLSPLTGCSDVSSDAAGSSAPPVATTQQPEDVIARVGDEVITYNQLSTMLNSSPMVGLSIPALGTPERSKVIITLLDKAISANLLYLDARKQGTDKQAAYTSDMKKFEHAVLASMYKSKVLFGDIPVSEEEVSAFYRSNISPETELNDDLKLAIEAKIRKQRFTGLRDSMRERLRAGTEITIYEDLLRTSADDRRSDTDIIASIGDKPVSWSDVDMQMRGADHRASLSAFYIDNDDERLLRLQEYIDNELMIDKAYAAGMEKDAEFTRRTAEYRKTRLINIHRGNLVDSWTLTDDDLRGYYMEHLENIAVPESRKVQMVVLNSKDEAEAVKAKIDSGEITMFQAAQQFSIDPNAKRTLGELGWVTQGTGFSGLDDFTFSLEPDVVGGPVESPAGWHLVKVLDVLDGQYQNIDEAETSKRTLRMYIKETLNNYVVDLRKNQFEVVVYDDELIRRFQKEADLIAELKKKAAQEGSITEQRQKDLQKWIVTPPQE